MIGLDSGEIRFKGMKIRPGRFGEDLFGKMAVVFQEPGGQFLMPSVEMEIMTVLQNLGLSLEGRKERFESIIAHFSLEEISRHKPENLSGGQMQIVNLACAMAVYPEVLLLDEPTTFLDTSHREVLLGRIDELWRDGTTVIHVTQYPDEALRAEKVAVLDGGKIVAYGDSESILNDEENLNKSRLTIPRRLSCRKWLGFDYAAAGAIDRICSGIPNIIHPCWQDTQNASEKGQCVLKAEKIGFAYPGGSFKITIDNLELYRRRVCGLVGPAGSGKSTLAFLLAGLLNPTEGEIKLDGLLLSEYKGNKIREKVGISWQMPDSVLVGPSVADDLNSIIENMKLSGIDPINILGKTNLIGLEDRIVDSLSGGEKRKVALAGALAADPDLIILDEPSAFLDPFSQGELIEIIRNLADDGKAVLVVGHDLPFMAEVSDRILGISDGSILFDVPSGSFFSEISYLKSLGLPLETLVDLRQRLVQKGITMRKSSIDPCYLASRLKTSSGIEGEIA